MEEALVLGKLAYKFPRDLLSKFKTIPGVSNAKIIFGPYDFYVIVDAKTKEKLSDVVLRIRSTEGVTETMTCSVVSLTDIRPEPKGPLAE